MADRVLSPEHIKKRKAIAEYLKSKSPKGKRGFGSEVDRLAIDLLYELAIKMNRKGARTLLIRYDILLDIAQEYDRNWGIDQVEKHG